jgi:hypothetical protein
MHDERQDFSLAVASDACVLARVHPWATGLTQAADFTRAAGAYVIPNLSAYEAISLQ